MSIAPGWLNCSSASLMLVGILHVLVSNLDVGVLLVMCGNTAQLTVVCQSVCLDLMWSETLWWVAVFTLLIPCIYTGVWVLGNLRRWTHFSEMKFSCEALSNRTRHGTYWLYLFLTSTIAVANNTWLTGLLLSEQYVLASAGVLFRWFTEGLWLVMGLLSLAEGFCAFTCKSVWCWLLHKWHAPYEQLWALLFGRKQL